MHKHDVSPILTTTTVFGPVFAAFLFFTAGYAAHQQHWSQVAIYLILAAAATLYIALVVRERIHSQIHDMLSRGIEKAIQELVEHLENNATPTEDDYINSLMGEDEPEKPAEPVRLKIQVKDGNDTKPVKKRREGPAAQRKRNEKAGKGAFTDDELREQRNAKRRAERAAKKAAETTTSTTTLPGQTKLV